jgi:drug/metabolite transporter (DMT)-like permease
MENTVKNKSVISGAIAISIAAALWGLDGVLLTPRLHNLDVSFAVFMLHLVPFAIMNIFLYKEYRNISLFSKKELIAICLVALFGGALGTIAIVKALFLVNFQKLSVVILIQKLQPIFAVSLAAIFLKEKVNKSFIVYGVIAVVASYIMTFGLSVPSVETGLTTMYASLLGLFAAFCFGSSTVFSKMALKNIDFKTATFYRYGITSLIMFFITLFTGHFMEFNTLTQSNWIVLLIIGLTTGSGAIMLFYYGLKKVKAIVAAFCELLFPITAVILDYFINDLSLQPTQWISILVLVFSIIMLNLSRIKA